MVHEMLDIGGTGVGQTNEDCYESLSHLRDVKTVD